MRIDSISDMPDESDESTTVYVKECLGSNDCLDHSWSNHVGSYTASVHVDRVHDNISCKITHLVNTRVIDLQS